MQCRLNRRQTLLSLLAAGCVGPSLRSSAQQPAAADAAGIRILFFNTHLLPAIAQTFAGHRGQDDYRTAAIAAQLHRYDLVGLCEVFEAKRQQEIVRTVQQNSGGAYAVVASPKPTGARLIGGGLLLLSRYPLAGQPHVLTYREASTIASDGLRADGFAAKGVIHARLRVGPAAMPVDCFLTHLESRSPQARAAQIAELADFVARHSSPERPALLLGDLNVTADSPVAASFDDSEYQRLLAQLWRDGAGLVDLWPSLHSSRGGTSDALVDQNCRRIDYIFLTPPRHDAIASWRPLSMRVEPFLDRTVKQGSLSDHAGVECVLVPEARPSASKT